MSKTKQAWKAVLDKAGLSIFLFLLSSFLFVFFVHPETIKPAWFLLPIPLYLVSHFLYKFLAKHNLLLGILRIIVFGPIILLLLLSAVSQIAPERPPGEFRITHNFVDLSQIHSFSKFRSCRGHQTVDQYSDEPVSNMQHYFATDPRISTGQVRIYAPFDGYLLGDAPFTLADGVTMVPKSGIPWWPFNQWRFSFSTGSQLLPKFNDRPIYEVKAGELIGYLNAIDRYGNRSTGGHLRLGVTAIPPMVKNGNGEPYKKLDSVFLYLSDEVLAEYKKAIHGLEKREDFVIAKEYRMAHPCRFKEGGPNFIIGRTEDLPAEEYNIYIGVDLNDREGMLKKGMCDDPEDFATNPECMR